MPKHNKIRTDKYISKTYIIYTINFYKVTDLSCVMFAAVGGSSSILTAVSSPSVLLPHPVGPRHICL